MVEAFRGPSGDLGLPGLVTHSAQQEIRTGQRSLYPPASVAASTPDLVQEGSQNERSTDASKEYMSFPSLHQRQSAAIVVSSLRALEGWVTTSGDTAPGKRRLSWLRLGEMNIPAQDAALLCQTIGFDQPRTVGFQVALNLADGG